MGPCEVAFGSGPVGTPPKQYRRVQQYVRPFLRVVPPFIFQSRWRAEPCAAMLASVLSQPEPLPMYRPPQNAPLDTPLFLCRSAELDDSPHLGLEPTTFRGDPVYGTWFGDVIMDALQNYDWVDGRTKELRVVQLFYVPQVFEANTVEQDFIILLDMRFTFSTYVHGSYAILALDEGVTPEQIATVAALLGMVAISCRMRFADGSRCGAVLKFLVYAGALLSFLFVRSLLPDVRAASLDLLRAYRSVTDVKNQDQITATTREYLAIYDTVLAAQDTQWYLADFLLLFGFIPLFDTVRHLEAHPRLAIIIGTIVSAASEFAHFFFVFGLIFVAFACFGVAAMCGSEEYATFLKAANSLFGVLVGEGTIMSTKPDQSYARTIFRISFFVVVYFVGLNQLLAIIVEAFIHRQQRLHEDWKNPHQSFAADVTWLLRNGGGPRKSLIEALERYSEQRVHRDDLGELRNHFDIYAANFPVLARTDHELQADGQGIPEARQSVQSSRFSTGTQRGSFSRGVRSTPFSSDATPRQNTSLQKGEYDGGKRLSLSSTLSL